MINFFELGLELASATETTARLVMPYSGKGDKEGADRQAVETLRLKLNELNRNLRILIGEGEKDNAPMLFSGERLGQQKDSENEILDIIVDPLECTTNFAHGLPDSMSVLAAFPANTVRKIPGTYMEQMLAPPEIKPLLQQEITLESPVKEVLRIVADRLNRPVDSLTVAVQNRPRHRELIEKIRATGAGVSLIESGSISTALKIIMGESQRINLLWGIFGAPEGLVIAGLARLSDFGFIGRIAPHNEKSSDETKEMGLTDLTLNASEWITERGVIVMSGIHSSLILPGVEYSGDGVQTRTHTLIWTDERKCMTSHLEGRSDTLQEL